MKSGLFLSLALVPLVTAFADTSPLFLYSTEDLPHSIVLGKFHGLATGSQFLDAVKSTVSQCTSDAYILVLQPGIHESDFKDPISAPEIKRFSQTSRFVGVMDAVGYVDINEIENFVKTKCQANTVTVDASTSAFGGFEENSTAQVIKLDFPVLPTYGDARKKSQIQNDNFLSALISMMPTAKYTVVYISTPVGDSRFFVHEKHPEPQQHESFLPHQSILERDTPAADAAKDDNATVGGLFSRYQFLTPVLVWSFFVVIFLLYIVSVGLSALSGITTSYAAFEKDALPSDAKKHK